MSVINLFNALKTTINSNLKLTNNFQTLSEKRDAIQNSHPEFGLFLGQVSKSVSPYWEDCKIPATDGKPKPKNEELQEVLLSLVLHGSFRLEVPDHLWVH